MRWWPPPVGLLAGEAAATPRHGWRLNAECQRRLAPQYGEHALSIGAHLHADGSWSLSLPDGAVGRRAQRNGSQLSIQLDARRLHADCLQHGDAFVGVSAQRPDRLHPA